VPACAIALVLGLLSAWTFFLVGQAAADTGARTNRELWAETVGEDSAWVYDLFVAVLCLGGLVQFTTTMSQLVGWVGGWLAHICLPSAGGESHGLGSPLGLAARRVLAESPYEGRLVFVSALALPLCLANDLNALRHASAVGAAGVAYAVLLCLVRVFDGSYRPGGAYASTPTLPVTNVWGVRLAGLAPFLGSLNTAFLGHLSVPRIYHELRPPTASEAAREGGESQAGSSTAGSKLALFRQVAFSSFGAAVLATTCLMLCGYLIFGDACDGLLLHNFAVDDHGAALLRVATLVSVLGVHPLTFLGLRDACAPLLVGRLRLASERGLRLAICACVFTLSYFFRNVAKIIAVRGAVLGSMVVYCLPCAVYLSSERGRRARPSTRLFHRSLMAYGALMAVVGGACVLRS
jgi:amino acid permease